VPPKDIFDYSRTQPPAASPLPRLMLVTDRHRTRGRELVPLVAEAVRGGVGLVQIREKDLADDELRALVQAIREVVPVEVPLVVNSSLRVARTMRTGLHLPAAASAIDPALLGGQLYGRSVHNEIEVEQAVREPLSYLLAGPIFPTESKPGHSGTGPSWLERVQARARPLPVYAIGGITASVVPPAIRAGAHGVAVSSAILMDRHPGRVAELLALALHVAVRRSR
jgi:thiamine-phosphate pyrophosphorylase